MCVINWTAWNYENENKKSFDYWLRFKMAAESEADRTQRNVTYFPVKMASVATPKAKTQKEKNVFKQTKRVTSSPKNV